MTLRTLNYGNYGIFLTMGNAGLCPSTVGFSAAGFRFPGSGSRDQRAEGPGLGLRD